MIQGVGLGDFYRAVCDVHRRLGDFLIRLMFIVGMRLLGGGGIGLGTILWFIRIGGFAQIWFSLLLFSSVISILHLVVFGVLADPTRIDEQFRKAWLPHFCRSGQRDTSLEEFSFEVEGWLPLLHVFELPRLTCQMLSDVVHRKSYCWQS